MALDRAAHPGDAQPLPEGSGAVSRPSSSSGPMGSRSCGTRSGSTVGWSGGPTSSACRRRAGCAPPGRGVPGWAATLALPRARAPLGQAARVEGREDACGSAASGVVDALGARRMARSSGSGRGRARLGLAAVIVREGPDAVGGRMRCSGSMLMREPELVSPPWGRRAARSAQAGDLAPAAAVARGRRRPGRRHLRAGGAGRRPDRRRDLDGVRGGARARAVHGVRLRRARDEVPAGGGAALYVNRAWHRPLFTFLVAFTVMCSGLTSAATLSRAFGGDYLSAFVDPPTVPSR